MLERTSEEFQQEVCKKFNTNLQQVRQDVEVLKEWIRQQPHLPQCSSDTFLTTFLMACKNRMERAKEKIDNYYTARLKTPDFFGKRDLEEERSRLVAEEIRMFTLPKITPEGCRVTMVTFVSGDVNKYDLTALCVRVMASADVRFNHESFYLGDYFVVDAALFSAAHVLRITPTWARDIMYCVQDVLPVIIKGIIVMNCPPYVNLVLNILKPFMKGKLLQRCHFHTEGSEVLEKYFPKKLLPKDYGGEEATIEELHESWCMFLKERRDWLMKEGTLTVDEKKRIGRSSSRNLQNMQGSFKSLCVD